MNLILAVNDENLENYIIENFKDIVVIDIVRLKRDLVQKVIEKKPDLLLVSAALPGEENISEILLKLTSKNISDLRISYLYGADDNNRKNFINFLVSRGVYDYYIGSELTPDVIRKLFYFPRKREDVKEDILTAPVIVTSPGTEIEAKPSIQFIKDYINDLSDEEKKEIGLLKEEKIIEEVIYQDKIIGTVVIGVAGASSGIGSTFTAINIARYIKNYDKKLKVALLEVNNSRDFNCLNMDYPSAHLDGSFIFEDIDFYSSPTNLIKLMSLNVYQYIILDFGALKQASDNKIIKHVHYNEFLRANLSILVVGSQPWQSKDISTCLYADNDTKESYNWKLLFNFTDNKAFKKFSTDIDWPCYNMPYCNFDKLTEDVTTLFDDMLVTILPAAPRRKNKKRWSFMSR